MQEEIIPVNNIPDDPMQELLAMERRQLLHARISTAVSVVLCLAFLIALIRIVPPAAELMQHMQTSLEAVDTLVEEANGMVGENTDVLNEAAKKLREIDVEKFNEAVENLSDAARPLASLTNFFSR